ncbi:MAG TPA: hypothetical protein VFP87_00995 [Chitinophagaceae bacterium]|nr:hypothetical protein [Chitinophagaceae bacterium]
MRKVAAISLICLLLFNWYGYRFVTNYFKKKADKQLEARIDVNDYNEAQLIEIRVPLNMPYQNNSSEFERHYGEIEVNGKLYTYVKRKIEDGVLILKCIPNTEKQNLKNADNILFTANNGLDQEQSGKNNSPLTNIVKTLLGEYDAQQQNYDLSGSQSEIKNPLHTAVSFLKTVSLPVAEQPPEHSRSLLS